MESHKDLPPLPCSHGPNRSTHARAEAAGERRRAPAVRASEIPASLATQVSKQGAQACPPSPLCSAREQPAPAWTVTEAGTGLCRSPQAPARGPGGSAAPRGRGRAPLSPAARACGSPAPAPAPLPARPAASTPRVSCLLTSRSPYHALLGRSTVADPRLHQQQVLRAPLCTACTRTPSLAASHPVLQSPARVHHSTSAQCLASATVLWLLPVVSATTSAAELQHPAPGGARAQRNDHMDKHPGPPRPTVRGSDNGQLALEPREPSQIACAPRPAAALE